MTSWRHSRCKSAALLLQAIAQRLEHLAPPALPAAAPPDAGRAGSIPQPPAHLRASLLGLRGRRIEPLLPAARPRLGEPIERRAQRVGPLGETALRRAARALSAVRDFRFHSRCSWRRSRDSLPRLARSPSTAARRNSSRLRSSASRSSFCASASRSSASFVRSASRSLSACCSAASRSRSSGVSARSICSRISESSRCHAESPMPAASALLRSASSERLSSSACWMSCCCDSATAFAPSSPLRTVSDSRSSPVVRRTAAPARDRDRRSRARDAGSPR